MNKKIIGIILGLIVIAVIAFLIMGVIGSNNKKKEEMNTPEVDINTQETMPTPTIEKMKEYTDPAGFKFGYPSTLTVTPKAITDKTIYADIEITSASNPGSIHILVKDETVSTIEQWMKREKYTPAPDETKEITLAGLKGVQFTYSPKELHSDVITTTAVIDQKVLFTISIEPETGAITATSTSSFWKKNNDALISSFAFVGNENTHTTSQKKSSPSTLGASDELEGGVEEIIE